LTISFSLLLLSSLLHSVYLSVTIGKTPAPSQAELYPRGRWCSWCADQDCARSLKCYGHPGGIAITCLAAACRLLPGMSSFFGSRTGGDGSVDYNHKSSLEVLKAMSSTC